MFFCFRLVPGFALGRLARGATLCPYAVHRELIAWEATDNQLDCPFNQNRPVQLGFLGGLSCRDWTSMWLRLKKPVPNGTLASGNLYQNLRFAPPIV